MASRTSATIGLFLAVNLLFFVFSEACYPNCYVPAPKLKPKPKYYPVPKPYPKYYPVPKPYPTCPCDTLKLGVCTDLLGLVVVAIGSPSYPCCSVLHGLKDLEAAVCLCSAIKANILGINLDVPLSLNLVLNHCGYNLPSGFHCD